jgi:hypothetical protein
MKINPGPFSNKKNRPVYLGRFFRLELIGFIEH